MLVHPKSSSSVLVMIRRKSVSICNHSRARLVDSSRNRAFSKGYQIRCSRAEDSLNLGSQNLLLLKSTFNTEHFIPRLSSVISVQFTLEMCVAA